MPGTHRSLCTTMSQVPSIIWRQMLPFLLGAIVTIAIVNRPTLPSDRMATPAYGAVASEAFDVPPEPIHRVIPTYPDSTERYSAEDMFLVAVLVDTTGVVLSAKLKESHPSLLEQLVLDAARQWRFTPAKKKNELVRVWYYMPLVFEAHAE